MNYFGRYIQNFADITEPFHELRRRNVPFVWGVRQQEAFDKLKRALHEYPIVQPFDVRNDIVLTTDASEKPVSHLVTR